MHNGIRILTIGLFFIAITSLLIAYMSFQQVESPLTIVNAVWLNSNICMGDLRYQTTLRVNNIPSVVAIYTSVWNVSAKTTAITDVQPRFAVMSEKVTTERQNKYVLSTTLSPGKYQLRIATQASGSKVSVASLPFEVPEMCK